MAGTVEYLIRLFLSQFPKLPGQTIIVMLACVNQEVIDLIFIEVD